MRLSSCLLFVALFELTASWNLTANPQGRNLSRYDNGGSFELRIFQDDPESYADKQGQIREFLWAHWTGHRLGRMVVKRYPIDQPSNTTHYFVEPDSAGSWYLLMRIDRNDLDSHSQKPGMPVTEELYVYEIQRAEYKKDSQDNWIIIPINEKRKPGSYILVIKDKNGKPLGYQ
jgi:hypothetical protein